jgi:hypothetical protein
MRMLAEQRRVFEQRVCILRRRGVIFKSIPLGYFEFV